MRVFQIAFFSLTLASSMLFGRSFMRVLTLLFGGLLILGLSGCKYLTPQVENELTQVGTAILCTIQQQEIDDPALDKLCQNITSQLTPQQRAAVQAHAVKAREMHNRKLLVPPPSCEGKDGGQ